MDFATYERQAFANDSLKPSDAQDRPLVVSVRERREGIVTKYQKDGAPGVVVDVADVKEGRVYANVLWMNGALVDALTPYVGNVVPIKLVMTPPKKAGGYPYLSVEALTGPELALAGRWAEGNDGAFEKRRAELEAEAKGEGDEAQGAGDDVATLLEQLAKAQAKGW